MSFFPLQGSLHPEIITDLFFKTQNWRESYKVSILKALIRTIIYIKQVFCTKITFLYVSSVIVCSDLIEIQHYEPYGGTAQYEPSNSDLH